MSILQAFIDEVLSWEGTRFHHMGRVKGAGVDCVGIAFKSAQAVGFQAEDMPFYPKTPINGMFEEHIRKQTDPVTDGIIRLGDLIMLQFKEVNQHQHLAIVTSIDPVVRITHAFLPARKVVTTDYDDYWKSCNPEVRRIRELV